MNFILFLIIGAISGSIAGRVMKGRGFGFIGNLVVGYLLTVSTTTHNVNL